LKLKMQAWTIRSVRKPITMRFDPELLTQARLQAARENRTLTNFIETVVRQRVIDTSPSLGSSSAPAIEPTPRPVSGQDH
jgi:hypothetical protein